MVAQSFWGEPRQGAEVTEEKPEKRVEALKINDNPWIAALGNLEESEACAVCLTAYYAELQPQEILIVSGSGVTLRPSGFAPTVCAKVAETIVNLKSADGARIAHRGVRDVPF